MKRGDTVVITRGPHKGLTAIVHKMNGASVLVVREGLAVWMARKVLAVQAEQQINRVS